MEQIKISPSILNGRVLIPPSKSAAHRMLLCASLSQGKSVISPACHSADIDATINAATTLGAKITEENDSFTVYGINYNSLPKEHITIDCGESGSTLRFIIPIAAALGVNATFVGHGRLPSRPINELTDLLSQNGVVCSSNCLPLTICGKLTVGEYYISGNISSQYLTGLLLALPLVGSNSSVTLTTPLESAGYIDMTIESMRHFGVNCLKEDNTYKTTGGYTSADGIIEGDWSQACFFLAAAAVGGKLEIDGLNAASTQGDRSAITHFASFGLTTEQKNNILKVVKQKELTATEIDCSQIPDMVPALAVTAALSSGVTKLYGAGRLRIKESDRIKTTLDGLRAMGVTATELDDGMIIKGGCKITGGKIDGAGDHRIVMAFSVLAAAADGDTVISGYSAINKSYPNFFNDYKLLGGKANVICDR